MQALERAAEAFGGSGASQLQFHNLVNNADIVPRLLGTSLDSLHGLLEAYLPIIQVCTAHASGRSGLVHSRGNKQCRPSCGEMT